MRVYFNKSIGKYRKDSTLDVPEALARVYVRAGIATEEVAKVVAPAPAPAPVVAVDEKARLRAILDEAGVEYDGRMGEKKLRELVENI